MKMIISDIPVVSNYFRNWLMTQVLRSLWRAI